MISAVILTKNEEGNIIKCLESLFWCDEIIIIDDFSEDRTTEKIMNYESGIRDINKYKIFQRRLNNDFAGQRNFGLKKAQGDWVIFVDADEIVTDLLKNEVIEVTQKRATTQSYNGYYIRRDDYFMGRWLMYGESASVKFLRLAKKNSGKWEGVVHEKWAVSGNIKTLANPILHYPHPTISSFIKKINLYSNIVAQSWKEQGREIESWEIVIYPFGKFIQNYFIRLALLDGIPGLILTMIMSLHSFLARSKYWLMTHQKNG